MENNNRIKLKVKDIEMNLPDQLAWFVARSIAVIGFLLATGYLVRAVRWW
jgi:hypothetical protein